MTTFGEIFITGISGTTLTEEEKKLISEEKISGVILFSRNYESPAQLAELTNSIQALRDEHPLFIAVDQEGGRVWRFKNGFTVFPPMHKVAEVGSPKLCFEIYQVIARELRSCGVNLNFAPVCDVLRKNTTNAIGDRAFGDSAELVSKYITSAIRGLETNGVLSCAKHFPGHGNTATDTHFDLPVVKTPLDELEDIDLLPFVKAVKSRTSMILMAHLIVDCLDSTMPTSLSPTVYSYLRNRLKYNRLIVTDDMSMGAIMKHYSIEEAARLAFLAGANLLIYRESEQTIEAIEGLKKAYKDKQISAALVSQTKKLIAEQKKQLLPPFAPIDIPQMSGQIGIPEHLAVLDRL